jgi:hypothetical protein
MNIPRFSSTTPVLNELGWLKVSSRIEYKILMITHKVYYYGVPKYMRLSLQPYVPPRSLRSADDSLLSTKKSPISLIGRFAFSCAAPQLWNKLPKEIRSTSDIHAFSVKLHDYFLSLQ